MESWRPDWGGGGGRGGGDRQGQGQGYFASLGNFAQRAQAAGYLSCANKAAPLRISLALRTGLQQLLKSGEILETVSRVLGRGCVQRPKGHRTFPHPPTPGRK